MAVFDTLAARLGVVVAAFAALVAGATAAPSTVGTPPGRRRAEARAVLTAYLARLQGGDPAGARELRCAASPGLLGEPAALVAFRVGEARPGVVGGMLTFPVVLRYADGGVDQPLVGVALGPSGPRVCDEPRPL